MKRLYVVIFLAVGAYAQTVTPPAGGSGSGSGTVTSVGLVGTTGQITVTGTSPITGSGSWTLSLPSTITESILWTTEQRFNQGTNINWVFRNITGTQAGLVTTNDAGTQYALGNIDASTLLLNPHSGGNVCVGAVASCSYLFTVIGTISSTATTNQLVTGAGSNLTTLTFPASSGAVTVTMPNTTSTVATTANLGSYLPLAGGTVTGATLWQPTADSTTFFKIVNQANNATVFNVDTTNQRVGIGTTSPLTKLNVVDTVTTSPRGILSSQYSTGTDGARVGFAKARGTEASPTTVVTGDTLGRLMFRGYDSANFLEMGSIEVQATGTIAATRVPTKMLFATATNATPSVLTTVLTLNSDQTAVFAGSVQATSFTTGGSSALSINGQPQAASGVTSASGTLTAFFDSANSNIWTDKDSSAVVRAYLYSGGALGTPSGGVLTNLTGSPTLTAPVLGTATATSLLASGIVSGVAPVTLTNTTSCNLGVTSGCDSVAYKMGYTFNQEATAGQAVTYTLPAATAGMQYCVKNSIVGGTGAADTGVLTVNPQTSSYLILSGTIGTISHGIASGGAAGDGACFVALDATHWSVYVSVGTWTLVP